MRVLIIIAITLTTILSCSHHPGDTAKKPAKLPYKNSKLIYSDSNYSVYLGSRDLNIIDSSSGETTCISLFSAYEDRNSDPIEKAVVAKRNGNTLTFAYNGTIYTVLLGPEASLKSTYPDPQSPEDKIIVDKNNNMLYLYKKGTLSDIYPVATGKKPEYTPEGSFIILNKFPISPDTDKERFGPRWLGIGVPAERDLRSNIPDERAPRGIKYGIHGTDEPASIGTYASGGCIRLKNSDILDLYEKVEVGTQVEIVR
ncbi:MAG: L,D-transpeptidase [Bacillota bacterium]